MKHNYKHAGSRTWPCLVLSCLAVLALFGEIRLSVAAAPKSNATAPGRIGVVTILEGKASVIRNLAQFDAAEGVRLLPGDLIRTQPKSLMRIEYPDECSLEAGPQTQLQLFHPADKKRTNRPALYLMQGWLKLGCKTGTDAAFSLKDLDVVGISRVLVIHADGDSRAVFAEQGTARVVRIPGQSPSTRATSWMLSPTSLRRAVASNSAVHGGSAARLPRYIAISLQCLCNSAVSRRTAGSFCMRTWSPGSTPNPRSAGNSSVCGCRKANDPAFRGALDRDLARHPEWDRILHPEKYEVQETRHLRVRPAPTRMLRRSHGRIRAKESVPEKRLVTKMRGRN